MKGSVYFNIRGEGSVIQASLMRGECNLLNKELFHLELSSDSFSTQFTHALLNLCIYPCTT